MDGNPHPHPIERELSPAAVLVDFENLVFGLGNQYGHENLADVLCLPTLFAMLRTLGRPVVRRAYGDWRVRDLNQFQVELYRQGFELVQVLGRLAPGTRKNATDIRLAVDAVELALTAPHLATFVIVSGDRDMIEIVRCLQKHGRRVIGIAPEWSTSTELSEVCDRFISYAEVQESAGLGRLPLPEARSSPLLDELKVALREILAESELPLRGTMLKNELQQRHGRRFGEDEFGVQSFLKLLLLVPDAARVEHQGGGDILVRAVQPVDTARDPMGVQRPVPSQHQLVSRARLANYRFELDAARRRAVLQRLHHLGAARGDFSLAEVRQALSSSPEASSLRPGDVNKGWTVLYQGRAFVQSDYDAITPMQFRRHRFAADVRGPDDLVRIYERCIVYKLVENTRGQPTAQEVRVLLGLQEEDLAYCELLLEDVRRLFGAETPGTPVPAPVES